MTRYEYEYIQERLSAKLHNPPTDNAGYPLRGKQKEGYVIGILSVKSMIKEIYHNTAE